MSALRLGVLVLQLAACGTPNGTAPPPGGFTHHAPTLVEKVVDRPSTQLLEVRQEALTTWVEVPRTGAKPGDYVLLGQGTLETDVSIPELDRKLPELVRIDHIQVVDAETATRNARAAVPSDAVPIGRIYAELAARADHEVVVHGEVVKASHAIGYTWVHLQDGTGDAPRGTHDLTVKTTAPVVRGQRVVFRGTLRRDVDLGFGYHYDALVEDGELQ